MSYYGQGRGAGPEVEAEMERARAEALEAKAERYAALHPDDPDAPPGGLRGLADRIRRVLRRAD
jgi:hypothetical protein